jgi:acyl carrier protein
MEVHDIDGRLETILAMLRRAGFTAAVEQDRFLADSHLYNVYATRAEVRSAESAPAAEPLWASRRELIAGIQDFLAQTLPDYMVPSSIHLLARLPMTPSGKVDRRTLSETARRPDETLDPYVAPSNPIEERLAQIWGEILEVDRVGVNSNFFRLGGHSLLATRTISQIRKLFQVDVGIASFFEAPTIAATARAIEEAMRVEIESLPEADAIRVAAGE